MTRSTPPTRHRPRRGGRRLQRRVDRAVQRLSSARICCPSTSTSGTHPRCSPISRSMSEFWSWARTAGGGSSIFRVLQPYHGALEALERLAARDHIVIVTTKPRFAIHDTFEWLAEHRVPTHRGPHRRRQVGGRLRHLSRRRRPQHRGAADCSARLAGLPVRATLGDLSRRGRRCRRLAGVRNPGRAIPVTDYR